MMMNPILGAESANAGKAPSAASKNTEKPNGSKDFSDYVGPDLERAEASEEAVSTPGESADSKAKRGVASNPSDAEGNGGETIAQDAGAADAGAPEGGLDTDPGAVAIAADVADDILEEEAPAEAGTAVATENQDAGDIAGQSAEIADSVQDAGTQKVPETSDRNEMNQTVGLPANEGRATTQDEVAARDIPAAENAPANAAVPAGGVKKAPPFEAAGGRGPDRAASIVPDAQSQPLPDDGKIEVVQAAAAQESSGAKKTATGAGTGIVQAVRQAATEPKSDASVVRNAEAQSVASPASGIPNAAAEQVVSKQPEGVSRAVQAGAQGAVQSLAAGLAASRDLDPGIADAETQEEDSIELLAAGRSASKVIRGGEIQAAPAVQTVQQPAASLQSTLSGGVAESAGDANLLPPVLGLSGEAPGLSQLLAEASFGSQAAHRPEMPRMIAAQIAEAFAAKGEQKMEVSLNPQELGHVKMRVVTSETGITMIIQTERPETGDLMRRHINELAEEFRRMGYEDISFEFSGGEAGGGGAGDGTEDGSGQAGSGAETRAGGAETAGQQTTQNLRHSSAGVDMRV